MENATATRAETSAGQKSITDRVRESTGAQLSRQKDRATEGLGQVAQAIRQSTQSLRDQQHDTIATYIEQAADRLDRVSVQLKQKNIGELVQDAQRFARRQPALFIAAAFALGVTSARFLKSSSDQTRDEGTSRSYGGPRYARAEVR
jgi:hypothetical protein